MLIHGAAALVTGGASGLGLATATALHDAGAAVVLFDLPGAPGDQIVEALGGRARFVAGDVTNAADVQAAVDAANGLGPLRIVVNCAGIVSGARTVGRDGPQPLEDFERVIRVNLTGTFNVIRLAAAAMQANEPAGETPERGVIVNTASVAAFDGQIGQAAYSASKGAVAAMTLPLAREFAQTLIRVMTIAPGTFDTPMLRQLSDELRASLGAQVPHPARLGDPAEYAALVCHIVENPMLNGEVIRLDGAIRMQPR
ncbi:SDR family NAD(P)-dependent oxidoreductase [Microterricola viridarii]|uniref:3-hydroxy-2-methylbutyryl-CoA dehydrogenase n=1 Tax=Microterricola viridarii TaxID=412690 RepID=A0A0X8E423_9MICO|nr:SDR family NAD(P)-dependent oxidoreductase [Microterricola viridarii]AMB59332.1 3-hydroxy-2-methylbutyryl-CoA dehydrogenase [Microterricola viridarii]